MRLHEVFTFRVSADDSKMITLLAEYYHRSRSDVVRMLIRDAAKSVPKGSKMEENKIYSSTVAKVVYKNQLLKAKKVRKD